jgi:DNA polymerase eta
MSLSFTGLEKLEGGQQGIEGFFGNKPTISGSPIKTEQAKRQRSSSPSIIPKTESTVEASPRKKPRLPTLQSGPLRNKTGLDTFLSKSGESSTSRHSPVIIDDTDEGDIINLESNHTESNEEAKSGQWSCPKCEFRTAQGLDEQDVKGEKQEHEDFHFAQDLQNGVSPIRPKPKVTPGIGTKKKKKVEGIKAFFTAKPTKKE